MLFARPMDNIHVVLPSWTCDKTAPMVLSEASLSKTKIPSGSGHDKQGAEHLSLFKCLPVTGVQWPNALSISLVIYGCTHVSIVLDVIPVIV